MTHREPSTIDLGASHAPVGATSTSGADADVVPRARPRIAEALARERRAAAACFLEAVADWDKYRDAVASTRGRDDVLERDYGFMVDYLRLRFATGATAYRDLLVGEKVRQAYHAPESSAAQQRARRSAILRAEALGLHRLLQPHVEPDDLTALAQEFAELERVLTGPVSRTLDVLLVGDCVFLDLTAFLTGLALADGVALNPVLLTNHNPAALRNELRQLAGRRFDAVFFSPFTYEFSSACTPLMDWRQGAWPVARIQAQVAEALRETLATVDLCTQLLACPVFVHNAALVARHDGSVRARVKSLLSWRTRALARGALNAGLAAALAERRAAGVEQLDLIDEDAVRRAHGERALGQVFLAHASRHPAELGRWLAAAYADPVCVLGRLAGRKLLVCDLDNTLWDGVIGEGAVRHFVDRQDIALRLKARGVVLAINSKNDPARVHWSGARLGPDDFVSAQINWSSKVENLRRIAAHLNLKTKDFVFIDDRADERELVRVALPEVTVLDATDPRSWRLLARWADGLAGADAIDRTRLYHERDARDAFLAAPELSQAEDPAAQYAALDLRVQLRAAGRADLKRVVELINRTNQFNTGASRTDAREAQGWLDSGQDLVLVADCADKFGAMGSIAVCRIHVAPEAVEIPDFVLSCRVFGYGIERVVVSTAQRIAVARGLPLRARLVETEHNAPCRAVYPSQGFTWGEGQWNWSGSAPDPAPAWLTVSVDPAVETVWRV